MLVVGGLLCDFKLMRVVFLGVLGHAVLVSKAVCLCYAPGCFGCWCGIDACVVDCVDGGLVCFVWW